MPRPRIYKDNAARQAAYRKRLKAGKVTPRGWGVGDVVDAAVVRRTMEEYRRAEGA